MLAVAPVRKRTELTHSAPLFRLRPKTAVLGINWVPSSSCIGGLLPIGREAGIVGSVSASIAFLEHKIPHPCEGLLNLARFVDHVVDFVNAWQSAVHHGCRIICRVNVLTLGILLCKLNDIPAKALNLIIQYQNLGPSVFK